jgi:hypothetical protein
MPRERKKHVEKLHFESVTLLSVQEVKDLLSDEDRAYHEWWWTRTVGTDDRCVADISVYGNIYTKGNRPDLDHSIVVRPALIISGLKESGFKIGDTFKFEGKIFKIISENLAFCTEDIGHHQFNDDFKAEDANIYDNSEVKKFVGQWFDEAMRKRKGKQS